MSQFGIRNVRAWVAAICSGVEDGNRTVIENQQEIRRLLREQIEISNRILAELTKPPNIHTTAGPIPCSSRTCSSWSVKENVIESNVGNASGGLYVINQSTQGGRQEANSAYSTSNLTTKLV
jgi:hypothetical protein